MDSTPRIFGPLHQPYYVVSPPFRQTSGGIRAMHYLCHALNLLGEEAYINTPVVHPELRTPVITDDLRRAHLAAGRSPIAVYPEVVSDNPLNTRNVVRYLLAEPGLHSGKPIDLQPNDLVFTFGPSIVPQGWTADPLRMPLVDTRIFHCDGVDDSLRHGTAVFINRHLFKGGNLLPVTADSIEISFRVAERSAQELADLFRRVECLYMYEPSTIAFEALLCGCPVVYILNDVSLPEAAEWLMEGKGISWTLNPDDIARAKATVHEALAVYRKEEETFWRELHAFIEKTQAHAVDLKGRSVSAVRELAMQRPERRIAVLSTEPAESPRMQARFAQTLSALAPEWKLAWPIRNNSIELNELHRADLLVLEGFTPGLLSMSALAEIFALKKPVIYDAEQRFDAAPAAYEQMARGKPWSESIDYVVRHAQAVVVPSAEVANDFRARNAAVHVVPHCIDRTQQPHDVRAIALTYGAIYSKLIEDSRTKATATAAAATLANRKKRLVVYTAEKTASAARQIRLTLPFQLLANDWEIDWGVGDNNQYDTGKIATADAVLLHRFLPGYLSLEVLGQIKLSGKPLIYETDAPLDDVPGHHPLADMSRHCRRGIEYVLRNADAIVVSTPHLARRYRGLNPNVHVLPTFVDFDRFYRPVARTESRPLTIGIMDSSAEPAHFELVASALRMLCKRHAGNIRISFLSHAVPKGWESHPAVVHTAFVDDYDQHAQRLKALQWDLALVPRARNDYHESEAPVQWLELAASGVACIVSDVAGYRGVVKHGRNGLIVQDGPSAWHDAIASLIDDRARLRQLARTAQSEVRKHDSLAVKAALYHETYVLSLHRTKPVALDKVADDAVASGVLVLDPSGDASRIGFTLQQLEGGPYAGLVVVVLTTLEADVPEWTEQLRYIRATPAEFTDAEAQLCALTSFDWAAIVDAGSTL